MVAFGNSVRVDVTHKVVNHNETFVADDGSYTNNVECMHGVIKRQMRRRYWQITSRGHDDFTKNKLQLVLFIENCKLAGLPKNLVVQ